MDFVQDAPGVGKQPGAGFGNTDFPMTAFYQLGAQLVFQRSKAFTDSRLCQVQGFCGFGEGTLVYDCQECLQCVWIHYVPPCFLPLVGELGAASGPPPKKRSFGTSV